MIRPTPSTRELFERSLELPIDAREAFLEDACPNDPEKRRRVLELLEADEGAGRYFEAHPSPLAVPETSLVGKRFGNFTFERSLGSGGMGAVYQARQHEPNRQVAIKLVHAAFLSSDMTARFRREAAVLAHLEHPSIARLYETGTLEIAGDTVPYLALELIENARPITEWAGETDAPVEQRLQTFATICRAIHFGHQRGIIHRDLKPDNLLVDEEGRPHVIDFGIARALDTEEGFGTLLTASGHLIGTPRYMSPEQLTGDVDAIDNRTDVYSLGLVLYELLTGEPGRPDRVSSLREMADLVEKQAPPSLMRHDKSLGGDLETILRRALDPDVERRYGSAAQLGREVERYLAGEPIEARRDHTLYVLRKKLIRHRVALSVVSLIFVILTASVIGLTILWQESQAARETSEERLYLSQIAAARNALEVRNIAELKKTLAECDPRHRGWEWGHLMMRADDSVLTLYHGNAYARDVEFSPDGRWLASAGGDDGVFSVKLWEIETGQLIGEREISRELVDAVSFLPGGNHLAASCRDGTVRILSLPDLDETQRLEQPSIVRSLLVVSDGTRIVTGGEDGVVRVFDLETAGPPRELRGHRAFVDRLAFSEESGLLATAGWDRTVRIWNLETGQLHRHITHAIDRRRPDLPPLPSHGAPVSGLAFTAGGAFLLTAAVDGVAKMWDVQTKELLFYEKYYRPISDIQVSPDSRLVLTVCSDSLMLTSAENARPFAPLFGHASNLTAADFSPDGRWIASAELDGFVKVFPVEGRRGGYRFGGRPRVRVEALDLSQDGQLLVSGDAQGVVQTYDVDSLSRQEEFRPHEKRIRDLKLDPTATRLATTADDRRLKVWDLASKTSLLNEPVGFRARLAWTDSYLITLGEDHRLTIRDGSSLAVLREIPTEQAGRISLAASEELDLIATGSSAGTIRLWTLSDGALAREWSSDAWEVSFDQGLLIASGTEVEIRNPRTAESLLRLTGQRYGAVQSLLMGEDRVATLGMRGGGPTIWDRDSGRIILELLGHDTHRILTDMLQLQDGSLVTSDDNGNIRVWRSIGVD